ncbi:tRNA (carboxymethyluridine(34)-5-O)-methyltransferase ALKBH8 isoform X1 [Danio rerio]|uniref:tRNA (carboxymethyluridine(34)-5-O)-methyltransferase n=2 Tax=Danio rerio TaxID=7955 RepID=E9QB52_DANRE|nr:alkylated DNA repair protein alkB homolog 8 isoform X1 [Danio rerio]|eukprot:XP_009290865.1 alkylated DNA repair protein alkB homolog 8 isoform X1 [Danio rerio]
MESSRSVRRTKEEKKLLRRQIKASHTLLKHEDITTVSHPTKHLVVSNGGLGNGVSRESLLEVLKEGGTVESLLTPPSKPYAFVSYSSIEAGQNAYTLLNGRTLQCQDQTMTLYFSYVVKVDCDRSVSCALPPGLSVLEDFVSLEEELQILKAVDWTPHADDVTAQKALKHRRVKHYGYEFRYDNNNVDKDKPLPGGLPVECDALLQRCLAGGHISVLPDQLTVNQYQSGQGIPPHVDTHSPFEDTILSLSLGAKTVMDFKHPDGRSVAVVLPERSLLVMKGESRYLWTHGITPRKFDVVPVSETGGSGVMTSDLSNLTLSRRDTRTSLTFRKIRHTPCNCAYPSVCDSQRPPSPPVVPVAEGDACRLESQYVHQVYEEISSHFSSTRHSPWPKVRDFLLSLPPGSFLADVGCGNGKYLGINPAVRAVGCDRSVNLVQICIERGYDAFVSDALSVPLRRGSCDACISIAVIHHFATQERRRAAVRELIRLIKVGGRALIYVWAMEQEYNNQKSKYLKEEASGSSREGGEELKTEENKAIQKEEHDRNMISDIRCTDDGLSNVTQPKIHVHTNRTAFLSQDLLVPWHLKGNMENKKGAASGCADIPVENAKQKPVFHRYYHVFQQGELEELCLGVKGVKVLRSYHDQGNWCVELEKTHGNFSIIAAGK